MVVAYFRKSVVFCAVAGLALAVGCSPIEQAHGYVPVAEKIASIQVGQSTRDVVLSTMGEPSVRGFEGDSTWYYVASRTSTYAFFATETVEREILGVVFDRAGRVAAIERYGLEDGRVVDLNTRQTVTGGRKLTFLQQFIGNIGNFSAESFL